MPAWPTALTRYRRLMLTAGIALSVGALLTMNSRTVAMRPEVLTAFARDRSDVVSIVRAMGILDVETSATSSARSTGQVGDVSVSTKQWLAAGGKDKFLSEARLRGWTPIVGGNLCRENTRVEPNYRLETAPSDRTYLLVWVSIDQHRCAQN